MCSVLAAQAARCFVLGLFSKGCRDVKDVKDDVKDVEPTCWHRKQKADCSLFGSGAVFVCGLNGGLWWLWWHQDCHHKWSGRFSGMFDSSHYVTGHVPPLLARFGLNGRELIKWFERDQPTSCIQSLYLPLGAAARGQAARCRGI